MVLYKQGRKCGLLPLQHQFHPKLRSPSLQTQAIELSTIFTMDKSATQLLNEYMQSGHNVQYQEYLCKGHTEKNPQYGCMVLVNGASKGTANNSPSKRKAKEAAALEAAKSLLLI